MLATKLDLANSSLYRRGKEVKSWLFYWMVNVNMFRDCEVKTEKKKHICLLLIKIQLPLRDQIASSQACNGFCFLVIHLIREL